MILLWSLDDVAVDGGRCGNLRSSWSFISLSIISFEKSVTNDNCFALFICGPLATLHLFVGNSCVILVVECCHCPS